MNQKLVEWHARQEPPAFGNLARGKSTMSDEIVRLYGHLLSHPLFQALSQNDLEILARELRPRTYQAGALLFRQGDLGSTCHIITHGRVRVYVIAEDGQELSIGIFGPGELIGEMAVYDDLPRSASVQAVEETRTLELDQDALMRCLRRSHNLALGLLRAMSNRLRTTTQDAEFLATMPVAERLLRRLERLAQWSGERTTDGVRIKPAMTQQELATLVGTTRESINRALVRLRDEGLVRLDGGWIVLLDSDRCS